MDQATIDRYDTLSTFIRGVDSYLERLASSGVQTHDQFVVGGCGGVVGRSFKKRFASRSARKANAKASVPARKHVSAKPSQVLVFSPDTDSFVDFLKKSSCGGGPSGDTLSESHLSFPTAEWGESLCRGFGSDSDEQPRPHRSRRLMPFPWHLSADVSVLSSATEGAVADSGATDSLGDSDSLTSHQVQSLARMRRFIAAVMASPADAQAKASISGKHNNSALRLRFVASSSSPLESADGSSYPILSLFHHHGPPTWLTGVDGTRGPRHLDRRVPSSEMGQSFEPSSQCGDSDRSETLSAVLLLQGFTPIGSVKPATCPSSTTSSALVPSPAASNNISPPAVAADEVLVISAEQLAWRRCCKEVSLYAAVVLASHRSVAAEILAGDADASAGGAEAPQKGHSPMPTKGLSESMWQQQVATYRLFPAQLRATLPAIFSDFKTHTLRRQHDLLLRLARAGEPALPSSSLGSTAAAGPLALSPSHSLYSISNLSSVSGPTLRPSALMLRLPRPLCRLALALLAESKSASTVAPSSSSSLLVSRVPTGKATVHGAAAGSIGTPAPPQSLTSLVGLSSLLSGASSRSPASSSSSSTGIVSPLFASIAGTDGAVTLVRSLLFADGAIVGEEESDASEAISAQHRTHKFSLSTVAGRNKLFAAVSDLLVGAFGEGQHCPSSSPHLASCHHLLHYCFPSAEDSFASGPARTLAKVLLVASSASSLGAHAHTAFGGYMQFPSFATLAGRIARCLRGEEDVTASIAAPPALLSQPASSTSCPFISISPIIALEGGSDWEVRSCEWFLSLTAVDANDDARDGQQRSAAHGKEGYQPLANQLAWRARACGRRSFHPQQAVPLMLSPPRSVVSSLANQAADCYFSALFHASGVSIGPSAAAAPAGTPSSASLMSPALFGCGLFPLPSLASLVCAAALGSVGLRDDIAALQRARREAEQKARLRALKSNDTEAYMAHLSDIKVGSLLRIMETTHQFMLKVGAQLSKKGTSSSSLPDGGGGGASEDGAGSAATAADAVLDQHEAARGGGGEDDEEYRRFKEYVRSTRDEYKLVHSVEAFVSAQPKGLRATLMPHQLVGLRFLASLDANGINGILADEMGVGKTIQTLAFLLLLKEARYAKVGLPVISEGDDEGEGKESARDVAANGGTAAAATTTENCDAAANAAPNSDATVIRQKREDEQQRRALAVPNLVLAPLSIIREWRDACAQFVPRSLRVCEVHELEEDTCSDVSEDSDDASSSSDGEEEGGAAAAAAAEGDGGGVARNGAIANNKRRPAPPPRRRVEEDDSDDNSDSSASSESETESESDATSDEEDTSDDESDEDDSDDCDSSDDGRRGRRGRGQGKLAPAAAKRQAQRGSGKRAPQTRTRAASGGAAVPHSQKVATNPNKSIDFEKLFDQQRSKKARDQRRREREAAAKSGRRPLATSATTTAANSNSGRPRRTPAERALDYDIVLVAIHRVKDMSRELRQGVEWGYIVVDEAHKAVSNLATITAQAISSIAVRRRLVLTGTPLNNDLQELWSLLHFINPDIFSAQDSFEEVFRRPFRDADASSSAGGKGGRQGAASSSISTAGRTAEEVRAERQRIVEEQRFQRQLSQDVQLREEEKQLLIMRMHQILRPFMLRRTKKDIDTALRITFHEVRCPLSVVQRGLLRLMRERKVLPHVITESKRAFGEAFYATGGGLSSSASHPRRVSVHSQHRFANIEARRALMLSDERLNTYSSSSSVKASASTAVVVSGPSSSALPVPPPNHAALLCPFTGFIDDSATDSDTDIEEMPKTAAQLKLLAASRPIKRYPHDPIAYSTCQLRSVTTVTTTAQAICNHPFMIPFFSRLMARETERQVARVINVYRKIRKVKESARLRAEEKERKRVAAVEKRRQAALLRKQQKEAEEAQKAAEGGGEVKETAADGVNVNAPTTTNDEVVSVAPPRPVSAAPVVASAPDSSAIPPANLFPAVAALPPPPPPPPHPYLVQKQEEEALRRLVVALLEGAAVPADLAECPMVKEVLTAVAEEDARAELGDKGGAKQKRTRAEATATATAEGKKGATAAAQAKRKNNANNKKGNGGSKRRSSSSSSSSSSSASSCSDTDCPQPTTVAEQKNAATPTAADPRLTPLQYPFASFNITAMRSAELTLACSGKFVVLDLLLRRLKMLGKKAVIFSHWLDCIDLLSEYLDASGWKGQHVGLTGASSADERKAAVDRFRTDPTMLVFIVSVKAGGCGLNLQVANIVIMLDRDYTATNEDQAIARVFRIGQKNTVRAISLCTDDAAEARILAISDEKNRPREALIEGGGYNVGTTDSERQRIVAESLRAKKHLAFSGGNGAGEGDVAGDDVDVDANGSAEAEESTTTAAANSNSNGGDDSFIDLSGLEKLSPLLYRVAVSSDPLPHDEAPAPSSAPASAAKPSKKKGGKGAASSAKAVPTSSVPWLPSAVLAPSLIPIEQTTADMFGRVDFAPPADHLAAFLSLPNSSSSTTSPSTSASDSSPSAFTSALAADYAKLKAMTHAFDRIIIAESDYEAVSASTAEDTAAADEANPIDSANGAADKGPLDASKGACPSFVCPAAEALAASGITYRPLFQHFDWSLGLGGECAPTAVSVSPPSSHYTTVPLLVTRGFLECGVDLRTAEAEANGAGAGGRRGGNRSSNSSGSAPPPNASASSQLFVDRSVVAASCWFTQLLDDCAVKDGRAVPLLLRKGVGVGDRGGEGTAVASPANAPSSLEARVVAVTEPASEVDAVSSKCDTTTVCMASSPPHQRPKKRQREEANEDEEAALRPICPDATEERQEGACSPANGAGGAAVDEADTPATEPRRRGRKGNAEASACTSHASPLSSVAVIAAANTVPRGVHSTASPQQPAADESSPRGITAEKGKAVAAADESGPFSMFAARGAASFAEPLTDLESFVKSQRGRLDYE